MLNKVSSLARALAIILAIVAGAVALGSLNTALVLVVLGLIAGLIGYGPDDHVRLGVLILALPAVGLALGNIPMVGAQLGAIAGNLALAAAGTLASSFAIRLFNLVKDDLMGLTKS